MMSCAAVAITALRFVEEPPDGGLKPYLLVRGRLEALVTRALYYDLVELAVPSQRMAGHARRVECGHAVSGCSRSLRERCQAARGGPYHCAAWNRAGQRVAVHRGRLPAARGGGLHAEPSEAVFDPRTGRTWGRGDWDLNPELMADLAVMPPPRPAAVLVP